jgi:hypothetical protein
VNALHRIHDALEPGSHLLDTQPISGHPPIEAADGPLGTLDMSEWAGIIATIDGHIEGAIEAGLFALESERRYVVTDEFPDGADFVAVTRDWVGTRVDDALAERAEREQGPVRVHQDIRLRVLRARTTVA